jgi:hypothetical protein
MKTLNERLSGFTPVRYRKVVRDQEAYSETYRYQSESIQRLLEEYKTATSGQRFRLIRDDIDDALRRFHGYNIQGNSAIGAHYLVRGDTGRTDFEHVLPNCIVRDLLIADRITINEAFYAPTCLLSSVRHSALRQAGLGNRTKDVFYFFRRYHSVFPDLEIVTNDQQQVLIDLDSWSLADHYQHFGI